MATKNKGSGGGKSYLTPKNYMVSKTPHKGAFAKKSNDGDLFTYVKPNERKGGYHSPCYITEAATQAAALPDDCYELSVLRMFRAEYVAKLPDGEAILADYREKAPRVIGAIEALPPHDSHKVWECLYIAGVAPAVLLITAGRWDEAYSLYRSMCEEVEALFLGGGLAGLDPEAWLDDWIEEKLAETATEAAQE